MTKAQYEEHKKRERSAVGQIMNTATVSFADKKDKNLSRKNNKVDLRKLDTY